VVRSGPAARILGVIAAAFVAGTALSDPTPERQSQLQYLLLQDCGSCHGLTLKGGLGPALTPVALAGKSPEMLRTVILHGRPGTPMPPWQPFITAAEADWLVARLLEGSYAR
jgi:cytochrome c55X